jgi:hypothetical protein
VKTIQLNDQATAIIAASGPPAFHGDLCAGGCYLHKNHWTYRQILELRDDGDVVWQDLVGTGVCRRQSFVLACPTVATRSEVMFLRSQARPRLSRQFPPARWARKDPRPGPEPELWTCAVCGISSTAVWGGPGGELAVMLALTIGSRRVCVGCTHMIVTDFLKEQP